ncbi:unnamed protein product [Lactuca virosa]|uniref:Uncharacterized protein n=1 Tax=Lactuca virosa TaxID=75947 RepID=A0AAU9MEX8_9ASTR|nr:unnamed protein product [Lactuca virosa]
MFQKRVSIVISFGYVSRSAFVGERVEVQIIGPLTNVTPMNKVVTHWNGIYTNFEKQWTSGESEASLLKKTHNAFQDDMQKSFKFIHVWEVVKRSIRWRELATNEEIANPPK